MTSTRRGSILALIWLAFASGAQAGTWRVGRVQSDCPGNCHFFDQGDAGEAIKIAMQSVMVTAGDTVMVYPPQTPANTGGYQIRFAIKSGVVLKSAAGPDSTLICGSAGFEPAISFIGTSSSTVVDGFTIRWSSTQTGLGGAIGCFAASGVVRNCVIRESFAGAGAAVYQQASDVKLENNLFFDNESSSGAGVIALSASDAVIRNNTFYRSEAPVGTEGAVIFASSSDYVFDRNVVVGTIGAPAVFCGSSNDPVVTCNLFWDNGFGPYAGECVDSTGTSGNIGADPLFCDPTPTPFPLSCSSIPSGVDLNDGDYHFGMCVDSPALTGPCGAIGYQSPLGTCGPCQPTPVASQLEVLSLGMIKALYRR